MVREAEGEREREREAWQTVGEAEASSAVLCVDRVLSSLLKGERKGRRKEQGEGRGGEERGVSTREEKGEWWRQMEEGCGGEEEREVQEWGEGRG